MTIKLVIFDFDGTLADSFPVFSESLNELAVKHGFRKVATDECHALRGMSATEVLRQLGLPLWRVPTVLLDFRAIMRRRIHEIRLFPGMLDALNAMMRDQIELAVATSNSISNVQAVLGKSLACRMVAQECGATLFGKSRRLSRILDSTRIDRTEAIYIGDEIRDAEAADRVGVAFGAVGWGYTELDALRRRTNPSKVFRAPADLQFAFADRKPLCV